MLLLCSHLLLSSSKANAVGTEIIDRVPLPQEGIAEDGQRTRRRRDIHAKEGRDAGSLDLEDVIIGRDGEVVPGEREADILEFGTLVAVDAVLPVEALLGANLLVQELGEGGWKSDEGGSGVEDDSRIVELGGGITVGDGVEVHFPVCFASERDLGELAGVVVFVDTAKRGFRLVTVFVGIAEVESEDWFVQKALVDHVVEWWDDPVDTDGVVAETHDTVEAAESEGESGF